MEDEHLHLLIDEEIYIIPEDTRENDSVTKHTKAVKDLADEVSEETSSMKNSEGLSIEHASKNQDSDGDSKDPKDENVEVSAESPTIPNHQEIANEEIPFAIFHSSTNDSDIELLNKIIAACKLPENQYQIFAGGFNQNIKFKKALVFVPEAKAFYTPIPYKNSEFLCSKPLDQISGDVQEKTKLWNALQSFVDSLQK